MSMESPRHGSLETSPKRGFLPKCDPKATRATVVRHAVVYSLVGAGVWLFVALRKDGFWSTWPVALPGMMIGFAIMAAICEWQLDRDDL